MFILSKLELWSNKYVDILPYVNSEGPNQSVQGIIVRYVVQYRVILLLGNKGPEKTSQVGL